MAIFLIGIDDTDNKSSPGTGRLARRLAEEIERKGAQLLGVTRHQFLVDDRIAYTSHNQGACIACDWAASASDLEFAGDLVAEWSAEGSDPGICIAVREKVPHPVMRWGLAATCEVLMKSQAADLAHAHDLYLRSLGGDGGGIIGALASVGLRAEGNDGRFIDLPGLRSLPEIVQIGELTKLGIRVEHHGQSGVVDVGKLAGERLSYKTLNWVRPRLIDGGPVWPVEWSDNEHAWIPVDHRKTRPLE